MAKKKGSTTKDVEQVPVNEDQSAKVERAAVGTESKEGKYPDHAKDVDFGGSGAVPYPVRAAQTEAARAAKGFADEEQAKEREKFATGVADGGSRDFTDSVDDVEGNPAPAFTNDNKADNGSPESEDRAAADKSEGGEAVTPSKSESSGTKAKAAAAKEA